MSILIGSVGIVLEVQVIDSTTESAFDISTATVKQFVITYPSGKSLTEDASFKTTGADGRLTHTTTVGELNESGMYYIHAYIEMPSFSGPTSDQCFEVRGTL